MFLKGFYNLNLQLKLNMLCLAVHMRHMLLDKTIRSVITFTDEVIGIDMCWINTNTILLIIIYIVCFISYLTLLLHSYRTLAGCRTSNC